MKSAFSNLFWGLLIVAIDIRLIFDFDVLADPVGYLLIAYGMSRISTSIPLFRFGKWVAFLLAMISFPDLLGPRSEPIFQRTLTLESSWWELWVSGVLGDFALLLLIYTLCEGTSQLAKVQGERGLFDHMRGSWWLYLLTTAPLMLITPLLLNFDIESLPVIWIVAGGGSLIGLLLVLYGLVRAGRDLHGRRPERRLDIRV